MYSAELVSDNSRFLAMAGEWNDAVERAGVPHPFVRHEWLRTWWDAFAGRPYDRLSILVVRDGGSIRAIAPLMSERASMYGVPVQRLRFLHNDHTPRADVIAAAPDEGTYRAIWDAITSSRSWRSWDVLQLGQLPMGSPSSGAFQMIAAEEGLQTGVWESGSAPYLPIDPAWKSAADALSPKLRQNVRNRLNRLAQLGTPAFEVIADPEAIRGAYRDADRLEASGWKAEEGTAIESDPAVRRFYAGLAERAGECPWLRLLFLSVDGQRIAGAYAAEYANRLFLIKTGYDPAFAKCSPFKLLTYFALQHAVERRMTELDFLGDAEPWKLEWTQHARPHEWLFVFAGTPRGRLLHPLKFHFVPALRQLCTSQPSRA